MALPKKNTPPRFEDTMPIDEAPPKFEDTMPIDSSPTENISPFRAALGAVTSQIPVRPPLVDLATNPSIAKSFGKAVASGATFGTMGKVNEIPGSVTNLVDEPNPMTRKIGKMVGVLAPLAAAEMTGGASLGMSAASRGAGALGTSVARGMGTGLTYGAMEGGVQGTPILDTIKNMAKTGDTFAGLSAAGWALGKAREKLGDKFSEWIANHFINTDQKLAEKLREQGKESLGKSFLTKTKLSGFKSRDEVYDQAGQELQGLERTIQNRLEGHAKAVRTPNVPEVNIKGTPLLEYNPSGVTKLTPNVSSVSKPIATPTNVTEYIPKREIKFSGQYVPSEVEMAKVVEPIENDVFGVPVRQLEKDVNITLPGRKRVPIPADQYPKTEYGGYEVTKPVGSYNPEVEISSNKGNLAESFRSLGSPERFPIKGQRPGTVDFTEVSNSLNKLKDKLDTGTELGKVKQIENMQAAFITRNGQYGSLDKAMSLKRKLDDLAGNIYTKTSDAKSAARLEAYEDMANNLRKQIYSIDPELGKLAAQESLLIRIRNGLLPKVAKSGGQRIGYGVTSSIANRALGNSVSNAISKGLYKGLGTPSKFIAPITRQATRASIVGRDDDNNSVLQELFQQ